MNWNRVHRRIHYWAAILAALPVLLVICSGLLLQVKKQSGWVQPPTARGTGGPPAISFDRILEVARTVPEAGIQSWNDVDRLDVRPDQGVVKVRARNRWEVQVDTATGEILQVAYRRSDLIESIHDGSFFHERVKLWVFLPAAVVLLVMWMTGIYLFLVPYLVRREARRKRAALERTGLRPPAPGE